MKALLKKATKFKITYGRKHYDRQELLFWDVTEFHHCKKCKYCKKPFTPIRPNQKYCCPAHVNQAWLRRNALKEFY